MSLCDLIIFRFPSPNTPVSRTSPPCGMQPVSDSQAAQCRLSALASHSSCLLVPETSDFSVPTRTPTLRRVEFPFASFGFEVVRFQVLLFQPLPFSFVETHPFFLPGFFYGRVAGRRPVQFRFVLIVAMRS